MIIDDAVVLSSEPAYEGAEITWFHSAALARTQSPGQFVMAHCSEERTGRLFARAFSFHRIDGDRFALLYAIVGSGTAWLAQRRPGDLVRVYGPLGKGFDVPRAPGRLLLVAGGAGVAPLVHLAEYAVQRGHEVTAMMGARSASGLLPASAWPREVEYIVTTEDGSAGHAGRVTDHVPAHVDWASRIYACGPSAMFERLAGLLRHNGRRQRPEVLVEETTFCGWGVCNGCAVFTKRGVKLCCRDGPRFRLFDLY
jgi:dihydroorotate dehydrogenase electron transfer subunit